MLISSRKNQDDVQRERLRSIIEATDVVPGETLPELITQIEDTMLNFMEDIEVLEHDCDSLQREATAVNARNTMLEQKIDNLVRIGFDEALDDATTDLVDAFLNSGFASSTFDGGMSFDPNVSLTKHDIKPLLRQAIITWVSTKVRM
jgi:hypothetical protein